MQQRAGSGLPAKIINWPWLRLPNRHLHRPRRHRKGGRPQHRNLFSLQPSLRLLLLPRDHVVL
jgi:hypothetical protein